MIDAQVLTLEQAHTRGFELVQVHTARFAELVRGLPAEAAKLPVEGSDWTVGQVVAHVRSIYLRYTQQGRRSATPQGVAEQNAEEVAQLETDFDTAAASILDQVAALAPLVPQVPAETTFPFHAGQRATLAAGWGNLLGELLAHGDDIARATQTAFDLPGADLEILWRFTAPMLQGWVRPEVAALSESWRLVFPFGPVDVLLDEGALHWDTALTGAPDHIVDIDDPTAFALAFPYRRRPITDPGAARLADCFYEL